jgi:hypothetical protein
MINLYCLYGKADQFHCSIAEIFSGLNVSVLNSYNVIYARSNENSICF